MRRPPTPTVQPARARRTGWSWLAYARISAAFRLASKASLAAGSAPATARNMTPRGVSAEGRPRKTWQCRHSSLSPIPKSGSAERGTGENSMSGGHSTYTPTTGLGRWIDARMPLPRLVYDSFVAFPVPRNLNYAYTFGG